MTKECGLEAVATPTGHQRDLCFYVADVAVWGALGGWNVVERWCV